MAKSSFNAFPSNSDNFLNFTKHHKPPPPPGEPNLWELQFCKWWGWNWVQKTEIQSSRKCDALCKSAQQIIQKPTRMPVESPKLQKRHFKELCQCLCFKKRPKNVPKPKNIYNTPSNSSTCICATVTRDIKQTESCRKSDSEMKMFQRSVGQPCHIDCGKDSFTQSQRESSDTDSCRCGCDNDRVSSTDESLLYLKVKCNCCKPERCDVPQRKTECYTQTHKLKENTVQAQTSKYPIRICGTQTLPKKEHKKKKHITVLCCHCCQCDCNCQKTTHNNCVSKYKVVPSISTCEPVKSVKSNKMKTIPVFNYDENRQFPQFKMNKAPVIEAKDWDASLDRYRPWDNIFSNKKTFDKFGQAHRPYPWIYGTKSEILSQSRWQGINQEFASPFSGKVFQLSPLKITELKSGYSLNLPDPLEINETVENLRKLEEQLKTDLKHRTMLDTACDTILFDHDLEKNRIFSKNCGKCSPSKSMQTCNSTLLQSFSYPCPFEFQENVNLKKNKSTQSVTKNIDCTAQPILSSCNVSKEKDYFMEDVLPLHTKFNKLESSSSHEDPNLFNINNFSFLRNSASQMNPFKRTSTCSCNRPIKRAKKAVVRENSNNILQNMDDLFKKMNDIIYMDMSNNKGSTETINKQVFKTKQVETKNNVVKISTVSKELNTGNSQTVHKIQNFKLSEKNKNGNINMENDGNVPSSPSSSVQIDGSTSQNFNKFDQPPLSSDSSLFSKIDEIINRSQATENQIQRVVLHLPMTKDETKRDYIHADLEKYISPKNSDLSNGLTTILESSDEISEVSYK